MEKMRKVIDEVSAEVEKRMREVGDGRAVLVWYFGVIGRGRLGGGWARRLKLWRRMPERYSLSRLKT